MKPRIRPGRVLKAVILLALTCAVLIPGTRVRAQKPEGAAKEPGREIRIRSDRLVSDPENDFVEFMGNVRAESADIVITAERLRAYHREQAEKQEGNPAGEDALKKIEAFGNVEIRIENRLAMADQAVYITRTQELVLTGENARIISGKNSVSGQKIIFFRKDGRITVEGGGGKPVEAILFNGDDSL